MWGRRTSSRYTQFFTAERILGAGFAFGAWGAQRVRGYGCTSNAPTSHIVPASVQVSYKKQYGNVPIS